MKGRLLLQVTLALVTLSSVGAHAAERTQRVTYQNGAAGDVITSCDGAFGGACFDLAAGERVADITVSDSSGQPVGVHYGWAKEGASIYLVGNFGIRRYDSLGEGMFCGATGLAVPEGATLLIIRLNGIVKGSSECGGAPGAPVYATAGTISIRFASE